jgi:hypothetical protein
MIPRRPFNNIRRDRESGTACLRSQLEALERWPRLDGELVELDEEIIGPLPNH